MIFSPAFSSTPHARRASSTRRACTSNPDVFHAARKYLRAAWSPQRTYGAVGVAPVVLVERSVLPSLTVFEYVTVVPSGLVIVFAREAAVPSLAAPELAPPMVPDAPAPDAPPAADPAAPLAAPPLMLLSEDEAAEGTPVPVAEASLPAAPSVPVAIPVSLGVAPASAVPLVVAPPSVPLAVALSASPVPAGEASGLAWGEALFEALFVDMVVAVVPVSSGALLRLIA
jgi:hypothetical protein